MNKGNNNFYKKKICPYCHKESIFINVGETREEYICGLCKRKTDFGKMTLITDKFGFYWRKKDEIHK